METRTVPCSASAREKQTIEKSGRYRVVSCDTDPHNPQFCRLSYEPTYTSKPAITVNISLGDFKGKGQVSHSRGVPRRISATASSQSKASPRKIAESFLKKIAPTLKIKPDLSQLKFDKVKKTLLGSHVLFQQRHGSKVISSAWVRVDIDPSGRVYYLLNDLIPEPLLNKSRKAEESRKPGVKRLTEDQAKEIACAAVEVSKGGKREATSTELAYRPISGIPTLAWRVIVHTTKPRKEWRMYVDAFTGAVLFQRNMLAKAAAFGYVFDPNPVVMLNNTKLENYSQIPESAYLRVALRDLAKTGYLDGPYVSTAPTARRVKRTNGNFLFRRKDHGFKEVMVYYHIDRVQRHLQEIGFDNILNRPIKVNVAGQRNDNSYYSPDSKSLSFGTGGVDDAEDAEVILHEYGHAIQDDQMPGFGESDESKAMGEGFGDFLAASFFADMKPAELRSTVCNWDSVYYSAENPPCLRRMDSNKKYPKDIKGEEHSDGEIWSACLWQLRTALGRRTAERLVIAHHFLLNRKAGFQDAAEALVIADEQLYEGRHKEKIRDIFIQRGILPNPKRGNRRAGASFAESIA